MGEDSVPGKQFFFSLTVPQGFAKELSILQGEEDFLSGSPSESPALVLLLGGY